MTEFCCGPGSVYPCYFHISENIYLPYKCVIEVECDCECCEDEYENDLVQ